MKWLVNVRNTPPGEFYYSTNGRTFGPSISLGSLVDEIVDFRRGNNFPGADRGTTLQEVVAYTCERLGGDSSWCYDTDAVPVNISLGGGGGGCSGCGASV